MTRETFDKICSHLEEDRISLIKAYAKKGYKSHSSFLEYIKDSTSGNAGGH